MKVGSHRLLGFAFASADLLIEIASSGEIGLAVGAGEALSGAADTQLIGRRWRDFVAPSDQPMIEALFEGLEPGQRGGPVVVRLSNTDPPRAAAFSAFRLPENGGALSCALSRAAPESLPAAGHLHDRASFEALASALLQTARATGVELELALIELAGVAAARERTPPAERAALEAKLAGVLRAQSHGGQAATELGEERFALVRGRGESAETLTSRLTRLLEPRLGGPIKAAVDVSSMAGEGDSKRALRALRYSLDGFLRDGFAEGSTEALPDALGEAMERTLGQASDLSLAIKERKFRLVYQPVVRLEDGSLHHYEALIRFGENESPFPLIRLAEELDLIESLDLAVLETAIRTVAKDSKLKLAVNVSGRTITSPAYLNAALKLIQAHETVRGRLYFEITESAAIDDLVQADRHLRALRKEGCRICLDDFGAGAASFAYLQQLSLDVVKIDGRYVRDLQSGVREATFIKHLVRMCSELGVITLAEMVESAECEVALREAKVDLAQGWRYGRASDMPLPLARPARRAAS